MFQSLVGISFNCNVDSEVVSVALLSFNPQQGLVLIAILALSTRPTPKSLRFNPQQGLVLIAIDLTQDFHRIVSFNPQQGLVLIAISTRLVTNLTLTSFNPQQGLVLIAISCAQDVDRRQSMFQSLVGISFNCNFKSLMYTMPSLVSIPSRDQF